jgi:hypothetical protein
VQELRDVRLALIDTLKRLAAIGSAIEGMEREEVPVVNFRVRLPRSPL